MPYYVLIYYVTDDYMSRRAQYRDEHLKLARGAQQRGELILGGAFTDPVDRAMLVFKAQGPSVVEDFVNNDPYVKNGLVTRWEIRPWSVVIGQDS